jgi:hypothetical protein
LLANGAKRPFDGKAESRADPPAPPLPIRMAKSSRVESPPAPKARSRSRGRSEGAQEWIGTRPIAAALEREEPAIPKDGRPHTTHPYRNGNEIGGGCGYRFPRERLICLQMERSALSTGKPIPQPRTLKPSSCRTPPRKFGDPSSSEPRA